MIRALFGTARTSGLLPAIGWLVLIVGVLAFGSGLWGGYEWRKGRDAIADAAALRQQQRDDRKQLEELRGLAQAASQRDVNNAAAYRDAAARLGAIASELESTNATNRRFTQEQSQQMGALLRSRPDLSAVDIGADGLRIWNQSNQGAAGGAAPPAPAIEAALTAPCPALPEASDARLPSLLDNHLAVAGLYHECAAGKSALSRAVREQQRTAWAWYCDALEAVGLDSASCRATLERL